jgi:hypothetical protein
MQNRAPKRTSSSGNHFPSAGVRPARRRRGRARVIGSASDRLFRDLEATVLVARGLLQSRTSGRSAVDRKQGASL